MRDRFYKFVHLQLFNVKCKFVQFQLFDVKLLFSEKHIFRKYKKTAVYGRASLEWWDFAYIFSTGYFPFLVGHGKDSERNKGFRPVKQSERLSFRSNQRALCYDEFLHTKVNKKNVYVDHGATENIPENACSFRRQYYGWRFDSIKLK